MFWQIFEAAENLVPDGIWLESKIKELENALGKTTLEKLKLESIVEEFEETYGLKEIKKKEVASSADLLEKPKKEGRQV